MSSVCRQQRLVKIQRASDEMKRNCEHLGYSSSQTKRTKLSETSRVENMLGIQELKWVSDYFESTPSESKRRRPNTESPRHLVLEANAGNAESLLEPREPQDKNESHRQQTGIMDLPPGLLLSIFSYLSIKDLCVSVAPVCWRWSILSKQPSLWKDLTFNSNAVSTRKVCGLLRRSPQLRKLTLCGRKDTDAILLQLLRANRSVERIEIRSCKGSRQRKEVQGDTLSKIVKRSSKLCSLAITETAVTDSSFYNALGQHQNRFKSLIMDKKMLKKYFYDFLEGYALRKQSRAEKTT
jgi:hypothetical protein